MRRAGILGLSLALAIAAVLPVTAQAQGQCVATASGLRLPVGSTMTDSGNLLVAESGNGGAE